MLRGALRGICPAEALGIPRMQNRPVVGPVRAGESDNFCRARPAKRPQSAFTDTTTAGEALEDLPGVTKAVLRLSDHSAAIFSTDPDREFPLRARWPRPEGQKQPVEEGKKAA